MEQKNDTFAIPHLRDYWFIIIKHKKAIVIPVILFTLIGILTTRGENPVYEAKAKIIIDQQSRIYTSKGKAGRLYFQRQPGSTQKYQNIYALMRSSVVARKTAELLGWKGEELMRYIQNAVSINPERSGYSVTNIVFIVARSEDPRKAMDMANYSVKAYIATEEKEAMERIRKTYDVFALQLNRLTGKLRDSEIPFNKFKKAYGIIGMGDLDIDEKSVQNLSRKLVETRGELFQLNSLLESANDLKAKGNAFAAYEIIASNYSDAATLNLNELIAARQTELLELLGVYTEKHPLVIKKKVQIEELKKAVERDLENAEINVAIQRNMLKANEDNLMYSLKLKAPELGEAKTEYFMLKQEVQSNRQIYNHLISSMKELNTYAKMEKVSEVKILEWAQLPTKPAKEKNVMLMFSPLLGLFLGVSLVFFLEYMDNTIKTDNDIKQYLGLPVIGIIQHIEEED